MVEKELARDRFAISLRNSDEEEEMALKKKEEIELNMKRLFDDLTKLSDNIKDIRNKEEIIVFREEIDELYNDFNVIKREIYSVNRELEKRDKISEAQIDSVKITVRGIKVKLLQAERDMEEKVEEEITTPPSKPTLPLPVVELRKFDGRLEDWQMFIENFDSLIGNNTNLTSTQKLYYLQGHLTHEPLSIVKQFNLSEDAYKLALTALKQRYSAKRPLASTYAQKLINFGKHHSKEELLPVFRGNIAALKAMHINVENYLLFELAYMEAPRATQQAFDVQANINEVPTVEEFLQFVEKTSRAKEIQERIYHQKPFNPKGTISTRPFVGVAEETFKTTKQDACFLNREHYYNDNLRQRPTEPIKKQDAYCPICREEHKLYMCEKFKLLSVAERRKRIIEWRRCYNCMGTNHTSKTCLSGSRCATCKRRHNSLLHQNGEVEQASGSKFVGQLAGNYNKQILLGTIACEVVTDSGRIKVRCIVDNGAQISLITTACVNKLGIPHDLGEHIIGGIGNMKTTTRGAVQITIQKGAVKKKINAAIIDKISDRQPTQTISKSNQTYFTTMINLADPEFYLSKDVDILLGCDVYNDILVDNPRIVRNGGLAAMETSFGFVISGSAEMQDNVFCIPEKLQLQLEKFWETEEQKNTTKFVDPETVQCEQLFTQTTKRLTTGQYAVRLPFKADAQPEELANRCAALGNFLRLEKKLAARPELADAYHEQIQEYVKMGQMTKYVGQPSKYILPQLLVTREHVRTTKMRIVFNASAVVNYRENSKCSFNDLLLTGPKLQTDLPNILTRFRLNEVAITADIKMMFRMIHVQSEDSKFQRIFYRPNPNEELCEYTINVLLFGAKSSPYLAQRTVKQLISDETDGEDDLTDKIYVDDYVESVSSVDEAIQRRKEVSQLLEKGGFVLRKWLSSHREALDDVTTQDMGKIEFSNEDEKTIKILGLLWNPQTDEFTFKIEPFEGLITKRNCLSYISRMYDCMGLVCPVIFSLKNFLQKLWLEKLNWDENLNKQLCNEWKRLTGDITELGNLAIPRCIRRKESVTRLVGFADGSSMGYAACVYLVVRYCNGETMRHLVRAKSKLSPLKTISIPRLELCGFLLLSRLCEELKRTLKIDLESVHLFTDSQIVLAWVKKSPHLLKLFVANRVTKIQELNDGAIMGHVASENNPADCATRGIEPSKIKTNKLWWNGPDFLTLEPDLWIKPETEEINLPDLKSTKSAFIIQQEENYVYEKIVLRHSSWGKIVNIMAFILRFINNVKPGKNQNRTGHITVEEYNKAVEKCAFLSQAALRGRKSKVLRKLDPFTDEQGLIRVGGRLQNSNIPYATRHPILLEKNHFTILLVEDYHRKLLHAGPRTTRALIAKKFHIINANHVIRQIIHNCQRCLRWHGKPHQPDMAPLPATRVNISRPFTYTMVDFAGPFSTKETTRRKSPTHKSYLCIFICESTKAVHLEAVSDLSTASFLACFDRFIARRSLPLQVRSDNGRNFVGASKELKAAKEFLRDNDGKILSELRSRQISWIFNPSYASHFAGLVEAGVKQAKLLLYKTMGSSILTFEEFTTLSARVEAILNSRPLMPIQFDPNEEGLLYLTPGHFLTGDSIVAAPEQDTDLITNPRQRWTLLKQMLNTFWKHWQSNYLNTLIQKEKWTRNVPDLQDGQLVYVKEENLQPYLWPIGRITKRYPGLDGRTRVVDVQMGKSIYRRPVNKLILIC